jgi:hypothetical protein
MPVILNIDKLLQSIAGKTKNNPVNVVAQRFLQAFRDHGVEAAQIPRLLHPIKLDDLQSVEALLAALTPDVLDQTSLLFGIRSQWLEGVDDEIYEYRHCYKHPELFFEVLAELRSRSNDDCSRFPLRILSSSKNLDCNDDREQMLVPILFEKIAELGDEWIYRYYIFNDGWNWGYKPSRIQLKAMVRMVCNVLHTPVPLVVIGPAELQKVLDRKKIPRVYLDGYLITNPSLEDFALTLEESLAAKEMDEIPEVLRYIEEYQLESLITAELPKPSPPSEPVPEPAIPPEPSPPSEPVPEPAIPPEPSTPVVNTPKSGKRADNNRDLWEPVKAAANVLWAEDSLLSIAEVIERIKKMDHLMGSKYTPSAIRKHVAEFAPPGIRGVPGRKPKKSP